MNKIKILVMITLYTILSSSSCEGERNENLDDKLTLEKNDYNGNELRIDGYYICSHGFVPYFLYRNGIIMGGTGEKNNDTSIMEEWFRNGSYATNAQKYKYDWGVFQIDGNQIKYEKWVPVNGPFPAVTYEGVILNDTTFVINKSYRAKDIGKKAPSEIHWEYHFKQFSPKPDSTNRFIP
jgi:hypothetical protein